MVANVEALGDAWISRLLALLFKTSLIHAKK